MSDEQGVFPMLAYQDGPSAMDWLAQAFGFVERARMMHAGRLAHGEMDTGSGIIMLASPTPDYRSPRQHREECPQARRWLSVPYVIDGVLVMVDDIDAHFARAKAAGAVILSALEAGPPAKRYRAEDLEGHRWMFMQRT